MTEAPDINHASRAHSNIVGGSTAARVIACPASVKRLWELPDDDAPGEAAEIGTACHEAMEYWLTQDPDWDTNQLKGMVFNGYEITPDLYVDNLVPAIDAFNHWCELASHEGGFDFAIEESVEIMGMPCDDVRGTCDIVGRTKRRSVVWDWKFGFNKVDPVENKQGMFYACGAMDCMPDLFEKSDDWPVEIVICQPSDPDEKTGYAYKRWSTTVGRIHEFRQELEAAVRDALGDNPKCVRGPHCRFARCKTICPLHVAPMARMLALQDAMPKLIETAESTPDKPGDMARVGQAQETLAAFYGEAMEVADAVEAWIKEVRAQVHARLEAGMPVVGYKLVPKRANRKFVDELKAERGLRKLGLNKKDVYDNVLISPAEAERRIKAKGIKLTAAQKEELAKLCPSISSGNTVGAWDDPRPAIRPMGDAVASLASKLGVALPQGEE